MAEPIVSVIMPVWKPNPALLHIAVESVLNQSFHNLELVIVEDPSTIEAGDTLVSFHDERIRHTRNSERTGLLAQRNRTLTEARAEFVAFLDADDAMEPDRIAKQLEYMRDHPDLTVLGSHISIMNDEGAITGQRDYPLKHEEIVQTLPRLNAIAQPSAMARKQALIDIGGYVFEFPVEDYDLWSRLAKAGHRFANLPEYLTRYRVSGASKGSKLRNALRLTRHVKRKYWLKDMTIRDRLRYWAEAVLLLLPAGFVNWLFRTLTYRRAR